MRCTYTCPSSGTPRGVVVAVLLRMGERPASAGTNDSGNWGRNRRANADSGEHQRLTLSEEDEPGASRD
jgi:hypothetical protein